MQKQIDNVNQLSQPAAEEVFDLVHTTLHLYRSRQLQLLRGSPYELTHMEHKVLGFFARHPGATQTDLVNRTGRDKAQLARLVSGLKEKGLLEGKTDAADRRSQHLRLTQAGSELHAVLNEYAQRISSLAVASLDDGEQAQLIALLRKVQSSLAQIDIQTATPAD